VAEYGGLGGIEGGRPRNDDDAFETAVWEALGKQLENDCELCRELWQALANVEWHHANGDRAAYSFRAAGDMVAALHGNGDYVDWYCCEQDGVVSERIATAMLAKGWTPEVL
jgi:hypothetical protein